MQDNGAQGRNRTAENLDINGLDTAFCPDFTSIPDKIPDKKINAGAEIRSGAGKLSSLSQ